MAGELFTEAAAGLDIDAYIVADGQLWNGSAFVTPAAGDWDDYAIPLTEIPVTGGPSLYVADFPAAITAAAVYGILTRIRAGASAAPSDETYGPAVAIAWDGAREIVGSLNASGGRVPSSSGGTQIE